MTLSSITNRAVSNGMSPGRMEIFTYTTTVNTYEVIATVNTQCLPSLLNTISVTTNSLDFKFEYTRDGVNWYTSITDYSIAAAANATLTAIRNAMQYRVSVKPTVAGDHGSCTWILIVNQIVLPPEYRSAFAYESKTVTNAAVVGFTAATMDGATRANVTVENNPIRIRWDGTDPTTSEGHLLQSGDTMILDFTADLWHFRAIATGANAKIRVTYSR